MIYKVSKSDTSVIFVFRCAKYITHLLHLIFNKSLQTGVFPLFWKLSKVVPINKDGAKDVVCNYRSISIPYVFVQLFEAFLNPFLHFWLSFRYLISAEKRFSKFLTNYQFWFTTSRSIYSNLKAYFESVSAAIDIRNEVQAIYSDFPEASIENYSYYWSSMLIKKTILCSCLKLSILTL